MERLVLDELDSTNKFALELGREGKGALWVMAKRQTASRGRRGRAWSFQEGNFAASYLVWPDQPVQDMAQLSFVSALALFDTVANFGAANLSLKWPNDVLLENKKLCGLLLETVSCNGRIGVVVGAGVNLNHAPKQSELEERALPAISLENYTGNEILPEDFLDVLAPSMRHWQNIWIERGFLPIREAWLARSTGLGEPITARLPNAKHEGVFEDVDMQGSLVLRTKTSVLALPAGDVYFATN